jgi:hypothetical protein
MGMRGSSLSPYKFLDYMGEHHNQQPPPKAHAPPQAQYQMGHSFLPMYCQQIPPQTAFGCPVSGSNLAEVTKDSKYLKIAFIPLI